LVVVLNPRLPRLVLIEVAVVTIASACARGADFFELKLFIISGRTVGRHCWLGAGQLNGNIRLRPAEAFGVNGKVDASKAVMSRFKRFSLFPDTSAVARLFLRGAFGAFA
jgi:hypothetical protein